MLAKRTGRNFNPKFRYSLINIYDLYGWINEWMKRMLVFKLVIETSSACISAVRFKLLADSADSSFQVS